MANNDHIIDRSFHNLCICGDYTKYTNASAIKRRLANVVIETDALGNIVAIEGKRVIEPNDLGGSYSFEEPAVVGAFWEMADLGL